MLGKMNGDWGMLNLCCSWGRWGNGRLAWAHKNSLPAFSAKPIFPCHLVILSAPGLYTTGCFGGACCNMLQTVQAWMWLQQQKDKMAKEDKWTRLSVQLHKLQLQACLEFQHLTSCSEASDALNMTSKPATTWLLQLQYLHLAFDKCHVGFLLAFKTCAVQAVRCK